MSDSAPAAAGSTDKVLFWGCFIALVTTAFGFVTRLFLINDWAAEFGLDPAQAGRLAGIGIWPFAVSIIGFSLLIDRIGYKVAMFFAFFGHLIWAVMGVSAYFLSHSATPDKPMAYQLLYWGSLILALANGTVESFINPVVATMFSKDKTKWLNILHAGWPGGLVIAGITVIFMGAMPWGYKVGTIAVPAVVYLLMLVGLKFPVQERVSSGISYKQMLSEFGILGAAIVGILVSLQLMDFFGGTNKGLFIAIGVAIVIGFGAYTQSMGRLLLFVLVLIMIPLATTEIGTDGWITGIMEGVFKKENIHPGWVLVSTSVIMMVLRFFAGPIVHAFSPLGLLTVSAALAIGGLFWLSGAVGLGMIFGAATVYALGKTFFWPTMLGVVSEQTPKGGALTLNAISGIGMLAVGTLGFPYIGALQAAKEIEMVAVSDAAKQVPGLVSGVTLSAVDERSIYEVIKYNAISETKLKDAIGKVEDGAKAKGIAEKITEVRETSKQGALANMVIFPTIMLVGYILIILYFKAKGGYKPVELAAVGSAAP